MRGCGSDCAGLLLFQFLLIAYLMFCDNVTQRREDAKSKRNFAPLRLCEKEKGEVCTLPLSNFLYPLG